MHNWKNTPERKELRKFGLVGGGMTAGVFGLVLPLLFGHTFPAWPWIAAAVLSAWAVTAPATLKPVYHVWMTIGHVLGWINTRIILGIMFFLIILPVGLLKRLTGRDPMERSLIRDQKSYRVNSPVRDRKHMERPY